MKYRGGYSLTRLLHIWHQNVKNEWYVNEMSTTAADCRSWIRRILSRMSHHVTAHIDCIVRKEQLLKRAHVEMRAYQAPHFAAPGHFPCRNTCPLFFLYAESKQNCLLLARGANSCFQKRALCFQIIPLPFKNWRRSKSYLRQTLNSPVGLRQNFGEGTPGDCALANQSVAKGWWTDFGDCFTVKNRKG